jgi:hypothetical protein
MSRVIVIEFASLDGVMHDPDGSDGSPQGGWAFPDGTAPVGLALVSAQTVGPAVRLIYTRDTGGGVRSSSRPR